MPKRPNRDTGSDSEEVCSPTESELLISQSEERKDWDSGQATLLLWASQRAALPLAWDLPRRGGYGPGLAAGGQLNGQPVPAEPVPTRAPEDRATLEAQSDSPRPGAIRSVLRARIRSGPLTDESDARSGAKSCSRPARGMSTRRPSRKLGSSFRATAA
jgi:hypothetical protein